MKNQKYITNVIHYLFDSCRKFPDKIAFSDASACITYRELTWRACAIGDELSRLLNGARNRPVFVSVSRSLESLVAFFGVVCSGNFYVPVNFQLPAERLRIMAQTVQPAAVLLPEPAQLPFDQIPTLITGRIASDESAVPAAEDRIAAALDTDPLYCIFTSGSTGVPKGVLVSHRSVLDMAEQFTAVFPIDEDTVFGNQAPFDFDVSVKDIYLTLKNGASCHILDDRLFMMPKLLIEELDSHHVNSLIWAASAMKILTALRTFSRHIPSYLRLVMFSGEALPCKVLNNWRSAMPGVQYVNLYGPTEITCNCTYYPIKREFADEEAIPIGRPFANTEILLLQGDRLITKPGEIGELCVRGSGLALGYYRNPQKTREVFCQNPLQSSFPERIYRTGDLACRNEAGELMFVGRSDTQIKHMGHRIEMGEIELAANAIPFVNLACCQYNAGKERLILFYSAEEQRDSEVFAALKAKLPAYMIPNKLYYMEQLPTNRTGKIDRAALKALLS